MAPDKVHPVFMDSDFLALSPMLGDELSVKLQHGHDDLELGPSFRFPTLQDFNSVLERESWLEFSANVFDCRFHCRVLPFFQNLAPSTIL